MSARADPHPIGDFFIADLIDDAPKASAEMEVETNIVPASVVTPLSTALATSREKGRYRRPRTAQA